MHCFHYNASKYIKFEYLLGLDYDEPNHHSITEKERYNNDTQFEIKKYYVFKLRFCMIHKDVQNP